MKLTKQGVRDLGNNTRNYTSKHECAHVYESRLKRKHQFEFSRFRDTLEVVECCIACGKEGR